MFDQLDPRSPTPLYAQIAGTIRVAVAAGELETGQTLPSVRQVAIRLRVNPATVVQAYRDLEAEGFVEMRQGAGTFIKDVADSRKTTELETRAGQLVRAMLANAARMGIDQSAIRDAFESEMGELVP